MYLAAKEVREAQGGGDGQNGQRHALEGHRDTGDDGRSRAGQRGGCDFTHRTPCASRVILRDVNEGDAEQDAGSAGKTEPHPARNSSIRGDVHSSSASVDAAQQQVAAQEDADDRDGAGDEIANVELVHRYFAGVSASSLVRLGDDGGANPEQADGRGDQAEGAHYEREENPAQVMGESVERHAQDHSADVFGGGGLEEVRATTGAVTHVVAHEVGDNGGVARVIFRDAGLDFTHEVSAYVCGFGIDTAAKLGEQRDEAGPKAKSHD